MSILVLTSDTLIGTPATGNIEYNGQFYGTDSNAARAQMQRITLGTSVTASTTSVDFGGIPAWAKRITLMFSGLSTSSTGIVQVQLGDAGGIETSGYTGITVRPGGTNVYTSAYTSGFLTQTGMTAAFTYVGQVILTTSGSNTWIASGMTSSATSNDSAFLCGSKTLSDTLTQLRLYIDGTQTFDAGSVNILYEG